MQAKKGINQRYKTLLVRETAAVQRAHLKKEFELAEASRVAEAACALTSQDIRNFEETRGTRRLSPGELLLEVEGQSIVLPFLNDKAISQLKDGTGYRAVQRELEICQFEQFKKAIPQATMEDLWQLVNQGELTLKRGGKDFLPEKTLDSAKVELPGRQSFQGEIPQEALERAATSLVDDWGLRPSQAEAMVAAAARIYTWCAPLISELKSGQMVWLAHGTKKSRRTDPALFQPVVLTLLSPEEQELSLATTADLKDSKHSNWKESLPKPGNRMRYLPLWIWSGYYTSHRPCCEGCWKLTSNSSALFCPQRAQCWIWDGPLPIRRSWSSCP